MIFPSGYIGELIHSVLPYLDYKKTRQENININYILRPKKFRFILKEFAPDHIKKYIQHIPQQKIERIMQCWEYIIEISKIVDNIWIEYTFKQSKPDLMVSHQGRIYIIEIKSQEKPFKSLSTILGWKRDKLIRQTRKSLPDFKELFGDDTKIYLYGLFFNTNLTDEFNPVWREIAPAAH